MVDVTVFDMTSRVADPLGKSGKSQGISSILVKVREF